MKKVFLVLLFLAVLTGGMFAQEAAPAVKIQGRLDGWWVPLQYISRPEAGTDKNGKSVDINQLGAALGRDDGGYGPRFRLYVSSGNQYIGFDMQILFFNNNSAATVRFDDQAHVWYKPFADNTLMVRAGKYREDTLRGKIGDNWMKALTVKSFDADAIFSRFRSSSFWNDDKNGTTSLETDNGVLITSQGLVDGLFIGLNFPSLGFFTNESGSSIARQGGTYTATSGKENEGLGELGRVYQRTQFGIGYTIQGIGLARVQYVGANYGIAPTGGVHTYNLRSPRIEAAFQVLALQDMGLMLDVGFKIPLGFNGSDVKTYGQFGWRDGGVSTDKYQPSYGFSVGAQYKVDAINLLARIDSLFLGYEEHKDQKKIEYPFELNAHIWPTYDLGFIILGADLGFGYYGETKNGYVSGTTKKLDGGFRFGLGFYAEKRLGNADNYVRAGLAYSAATEVNHVKESGVFSIPIVFQTLF